MSMFRTSSRHSALQKLADGFLFSGGTFLTLHFIWGVWGIISGIYHHASFDTITASYTTGRVDFLGYGAVVDFPGNEPAEPTFYDDRNLSYTIGQPVEDWDGKRKEWLKHHTSFSAAAAAHHQLLLVTGSETSVCTNSVGDHLQIRLLKNKVDYARLHGYHIFYNNVLLHPKEYGGWAKYPLLRAAMLAQPEAEWIWWIDSDAMFTDMEFRLPLERYKDHNLVVHGWWPMLYKEQSWASLNTGVFLIRNCQWSMDLIEAWTSMGPQSPDYKRWGWIQMEIIKDKLLRYSDDQSALIYLLLEEKESWAEKTYLESEYGLQGDWLKIVDGLDNIAKEYKEIDREIVLLKRRNAEKLSLFYGKMRERYMKHNLRRPFVTHFNGCAHCSGEQKRGRNWEACWNGMHKALNFADNQVLRTFGFVHPDLLNSSLVSPLPFDFPA